MARDHARLQVGIWHDPDFLKLGVEAQHTYFTLLSQPRLSYVGVIDYFPTRIAALSSGNSQKKVQLAVARLKKDRFVVVDEATAELLVRSYVRHDGVLTRVNMGKAVARAFQKVMSLSVRAAIIDELARAFAADSDLAGWEGFEDVAPDDMKQVIEVASRMQFDIPLPIESRM